MYSPFGFMHLTHQNLSACIILSKFTCKSKYAVVSLQIMEAFSVQIKVQRYLLIIEVRYKPHHYNRHVNFQLKRWNFVFFKLYTVSISSHFEEFWGNFTCFSSFFNHFQTYEMCSHACCTGWVKKSAIVTKVSFCKILNNFWKLTGWYEYLTIRLNV